jgi:tetratricopeptide (TPR) repeat protein
MVVELDRFWHNRGHLAECLDLIQRAIDLVGDDADSDLRCDALRLAGEAAIARDAAVGTQLFSASLALARETGDDFHAALALGGLAMAAYFMGEANTSRAFGREAVDVARRVGDPVLLGRCLVDYLLGASADLEFSRSIGQEAIEVTHHSGDRAYLGWAHNNLGNAMLAHEQWSEAREQFERARIILAEVGTPNPTPLINLGSISLNEQNFAQATNAFGQSLRICRRSGLRFESAYALLGLACTAIQVGESDHGVRLVGFADNELESCGQSWEEPERTYRLKALEHASAQLGAAFDTAYAAGRTDARDEMIDLALNPRISRGV